MTTIAINMTKIIKYLLLLILLVIVMIIFKNMFLFFTYNFDVNYLENISVNNQSKKYDTSIDTYEGGYDLHKNIIIEFNEDSTGTYTTEYYYFKIDGNTSTSFTFHSLIPFDKEKKRIDVSPFIQEKEYLKIFEKNKDTIFVKYKIVNEKLFLDRNAQYKKYANNPEWGFMFNSKPDFLDMLKFWYF